MNSKTSNNSSQITLAQRVAILGALVGASSDEIDGAIVELRKEKRERQVSERAKRRLRIKLETGRMVQQ